jgi:hypothetical protein
MISGDTFRGLGLAIFVLGALPLAQASIINVNSNGGDGEFNVVDSVEGDDVAVTVSPAWAPSGMGYEWVSYGNTGCNTFNAITGVCTAGIGNPAGVSGTITLPDPVAPTAVFFNDFTLPADSTYSGTLSVWADDTARVYLDGILLIDANPVMGSNCSNAPIGCLPNMDYTVDLSTLSGVLQPGLNVLEIDAYQLIGGSPFGVMYTGSIDADPAGSPTPEPASYVLMGLGLIGIGVLVPRVRRA